MKRFVYILMILAGAAAVSVSCQREVFPEQIEVPDGYERISFRIDAPDFTEVATKAVDPDGGYVQNMILFCFDEFGMFITATEADITVEDSGLVGRLTATVPMATQRIHFVANQNFDKLNQNALYNMEEAQAMETLEASSGRMIYWGYKWFDPNFNGTLQAQFPEGEKIKLIRNHALIEVNNRGVTQDANGNDIPATTANQHMEVHGMTVYNSHAFGTVCPWHNTEHFKMPNWPSVGDGKDFVTIPRKKDKLSEVDRTTSDFSRYVYEHENSVDDPIYVIIQATDLSVADADPLFYKVMLIDDQGNQIMVRRNHKYTIHIKGRLTNGAESFAAALEEAPTNNVWVSISHEIKRVQDSNFILEVDKTDHVLAANEYVKNESANNNPYTITYTLTPRNGQTLTADTIVDGKVTEESPDRPEVDWVNDIYDVANYTFDHVFKVEGGVGKGEITIYLSDLVDDETKEELNSLSSSLMIRKGKLFRTVTVVTIREQKMTPAWVSSEIYRGSTTDMGDMKDLGAHVTVMFTIPETTPKELFPFDVLISCNKLDSRYIPGSDNVNNSYDAYAPPIIKVGDEGYGDNFYYTDVIDPATGKPKVDENGNVVREKHDLFGYKYVHTVTEAGPQRLYFYNILQEVNDFNTIMYLEAPHFEPVLKKIHFTEQKWSIWYDESTINYIMPGKASDEATDEKIYYILVPQKRNALVKFGVQLYNNNNNNNNNADRTNALADDEFLLYASNIVPDPHDMTDPTAICEYRTVPKAIWEDSSNGQMVGFRPRYYPDNNINMLTHTTYTLEFRTTKPKSEEAVRISSVPKIYDPTSGSAAPTPEGYSSYSGRSIFDPDDTPLASWTKNTESSMTAAEYTELYPWYVGRSFRSNTFELSNYNPFRFAAQVIFQPNDPNGEHDDVNNPKGNKVSAGYGCKSDLVPKMENGKVVKDNDGNVVLVPHIGERDYATPEMVSEVMWPYIPGAEVDIEIDVTSFGGSDYKSVDPFGESFEIYIKAPMLIIDEDRLAECKLNGTKLREVAPGEFVYTVDANRETERQYGYASALRGDIDPIIETSYLDANGNTVNGNKPYNVPGNQAGERKKLPFLVKGIVTAGQIEISSNEEKVVYHKKTFNITNAPRIGTITYGPVDNPIPVKKDEFVPFELASNHNRIGVMTIYEDGKFSFKLRTEYNFYWDSGEVLIRYEDPNGKVYTLTQLPVVEGSTHDTELTLENLFAHLKEGHGIHLLEATAATGIYTGSGN